MKVYFYLVISVGLMILLNMAGIQVPSNLLIDSLNIFDLENFTSSTFYKALVGVMIFGVASIGIGALLRTSLESSLIAGFVSGTLVLLLGDIISIYIHMRKIGAEIPSWTANLALLIIAPFIIGYAISLIEFWRGTD